MLKMLAENADIATGAALGGSVVLASVGLVACGLSLLRRVKGQSPPAPTADTTGAADAPATPPVQPASSGGPGATESQQTARLLDGLPVPAFVKDRTGRYKMVNGAFATWFELNPHGIVGRTDRELMPSSLALHMIAGDREALSQHKPITEPLDVVLPSGSARTVDLIRFPLGGGDGEPLELAGIVIDTTEHTRAKLELIENKHQAELANRSKSEFLANMSHELRTPLNAVIGFSEIIKTEMLGPVGLPSYVEYGSDIHESATHLLGLINDILDLSKIEAGSEELAEEAVLLPDLIASVITLVKSRAHSNGVKLDTEAMPDPPVLYVDRRKVKQILVNLLTNAIKFTPEGGQVTLQTSCEQGSGDFIFRVVDTGVGMAEEDIPTALTPFSQLGRQLSRSHEGTGLGLPLTKRMVEMHFGTLTVVSALGEGTTIIVRFPASRVSWPDQEAAAPGSAEDASVFGTV